MLKYIFAVLVSLPILLLTLCYIAPSVHPESSRILTLLAYLYPYILLLSLLALGVVVLSTKWKLAALHILIFVLGWNLHTRYYAFGSAIENTEAQFKIMSYNVRSFDLYEHQGFGENIFRDSIMNFLELQQPDILCLQEFFYENRPKQFMTIQRIKEKTGLNHHAGAYSIGTNKLTYFGCIILSSFPIVNKGIVDLEVRTTNHCVFADIQMDTSLIRVYNFHIGSISFSKEDYVLYDEFNMEISEDEKSKALSLIYRFLIASRTRAQQLALILEHAENSPHPVILCGDLNDTPTSYAYNEITNGYDDAFTKVGSGFGKTYVGKMPSNRIDYIFYDKHFQALDFMLQKEILSDHRAIEVQMRIRK